MGTFTININADPTVTSGAEISSTSIQPGSVKFTISGADLYDVLTVGIKVTDMSADGFDYYYAAIGGTSFYFSPSNSGVEVTGNVTHSTEPKTYDLIFYDNPDTAAVLIEVRLISSTGLLSNVNQYRQMAYSNF